MHCMDWTTQGWTWIKNDTPVSIALDEFERVLGDTDLWWFCVHAIDVSFNLIKGKAHLIDGF